MKVHPKNIVSMNIVSREYCISAPNLLVNSVQDTKSTSEYCMNIGKKAS